MSLQETFIAALADVLGGVSSQAIPLHEPEFIGNEWSYVKTCLDTGWVSSVGKYVDQFERQLCELTGAKFAVAVVNGTAALHLALRLSGVGENDEVLIPALSFVGTANAVAHCGAYPHFVDSDPLTLGLDPRVLKYYLQQIVQLKNNQPMNIKSGRRLAALVPMHTFGHPVALDDLLEVAEEFALPVIEDAAESLGSFYKGGHTGTHGRFGILSFNGNKVITTGGGGAILTNDRALALRARHLTTTAKLPHRWEFVHDEVAFNYRLPNINAALGCAQLETLPTVLARKRKLALKYHHAFAKIPELHVIKEPVHSQSNYWLNAIRLQNPDVSLRNLLLETAHAAGYQCRPVWRLLSGLPMYRDCPRAPLPVAERLEASLINLPSSAKLCNEINE